MTDTPGNGVLVHLTDGRCSLLISSAGDMPRLVHWGAQLGEVDGRVLLALERTVPRGGLDVDAPMGLVAEPGVGWFGPPGIEGTVRTAAISRRSSSFVPARPQRPKPTSS